MSALSELLDDHEFDGVSCSCGSFQPYRPHLEELLEHLSSDDGCRALDSLGLSVELVEGKLLSDALLLMNFIAPDGTESLRLSTSVGMTQMTKIGMLRAMESAAIANLTYGED